MEVLNMIGKPCPIPVVEAKKALADSSIKEIMVTVDNIVAVQNLEKMAKGKEFGFSYEEQEPGIYNVILSKFYDVILSPTANSPDLAHKAGAAQKLPDDNTYLITKNKMGEGNDELGEILIKGFIYSLMEMEVKPSRIIFLNSGVKLVVEGANTLPDIRKLAESGTEIYSCGTCLNFYNLTDKLGVGTVTDMFHISEILSGKTKVITI